MTVIRHPFQILGAIAVVAKAQRSQRTGRKPAICIHQASMRPRSFTTLLLRPASAEAVPMFVRYRTVGVLGFLQYRSPLTEYGLYRRFSAQRL
jgi:hypothetical protein